MNGRIQGRRIRIRRSPSVAASLLTELNPFLVNVTGQSGYELNGLSSGANNVCIGLSKTGPDAIEMGCLRYPRKRPNCGHRGASGSCR